MPRDLRASPELLFADLVAVHPQLAGQFPDYFDGTGSVGVFVPAARVPIAVEWLQSVLAQIDPGDRRHYHDLVRTLEVARDRGCAYWEATEVGVVRRPEPLPDRPVRAVGPGVRKHVAAAGAESGRRRREDLLSRGWHVGVAHSRGIRVPRSLRPLRQRVLEPAD